MANQIKPSGAAELALQVTKIIRASGLVEEDAEGEVTYLAIVRVYAFDHLLLVVVLDTVSVGERAELVVAAAQDISSVHRAMHATIRTAGHGYQVQLPPAEDAGFSEGDRAPCHSAPGMIAISRDDGTSAGADASRLARDLVAIRQGQYDAVFLKKLR